MSSESMEEDEPIIPLRDKNNEDYMETCDDEVNNMVPRLEKMSINDDEPMILTSNNRNMSDCSMGATPTVMHDFNVPPKTDLNENISSIFFGNVIDKRLVHEVTKASVASENPLSKLEETLQVISSNTPVDIQCQDDRQNPSIDSEIHKYTTDQQEQMLDKSDETVEIRQENLLNLPSNCDLDHIKESELKSTKSEDITEFMSSPESCSVNFIDPETGDFTINSNILIDTINSTSNAMNQFCFDLANYYSYSADESSDDQSSKSCSNMTDSSSDNDALNVDSLKNKYPKIFQYKFFKFIGMTEKVVPRRRGALWPSSSSSDVTDAPTANCSDEDSKKSSGIEEETPVNPRRRRFSVFQLPSSFIGMHETSKTTSDDENSSAVKKNRQQGFCVFQPSSDVIDMTKTSKANSSDEDSKKSNAIRKDGLINSRQRRFGTFHKLSNLIAPVKTSNIVSSSTDSEKSKPVWKVSPINSQRKRRKSIKSSRPITLNPSNANDGERRPGTCKRKKTMSENSTGTAGKFRKRSLSEHNAKTGEKTYLSIRSRSLSPTPKNNDKTSVINTDNSILKVPKSRKRANSHSEISNRTKFRRPSSSSDDTENK